MEKNEISIRSNHFSIPKKYFDQAYKEVVLHLSTDKNVVFIYPKYKFENICKGILKKTTESDKEDRELIRDFSGYRSFGPEKVNEKNRKVNLHNRVIESLKLTDKALLIYDPEKEIDRLVLCKDEDAYNNYKKGTSK